MKFWAGFECSTHRRHDGVRLDLLRATRHDRAALEDYRLCARFDLHSVRDGLRWHRIEAVRGQLDWSSWDPMVEAAEQAGVSVTWDLLHFGLPDHQPADDPDFAVRFCEFALAAAERHLRLTGRALDHCLVNEASFWSWAVGRGGWPMPSPIGGPALKLALAKAAIAAGRAMDDEGVAGKRLWSEPLINVASRSSSSRDLAAAAAEHEAQYEFLDVVFGRLHPELGGGTELGGTVGLNVYPSNQFYASGGSTIPLGHHAFRPLSDLLEQVWRRFCRPLMISETGAEGPGRAAWLHYLCDEVRIACRRGVPVGDVCLYPITDYPGWDDGRSCETGLFGQLDGSTSRPIFAPLLEEIERQRAIGRHLADVEPRSNHSEQ